MLLNFLVSAQSTTLDFEPHGQIVKFHFDSLTIYSDTTSLFSVYDKEGVLKDYDLKVKNFVRKQVAQTSSDTIIFTGKFIPFNDGIAEVYLKEWDVEWAILHLTKEKKLKIYDKHGKLVKIIITKKIGKKKKNYVERSYINKTTNEELFNEVLFIRIIEPSF